MRLVSEVPEAGHARSVEQRLGILQPERDPVRPQAILRQEEIRRCASRILSLPQLPDDVAVHALQLLEELLHFLEPLPGGFVGLRGQIGEALARGGREKVHHIRRVGVAEVESGHAHGQPGPQRNRPLEESEEPVRLHFRALAGQHRRSEGLVVLVELIADLAAALLDDVAVAAAVPVDQLFAAVHGHLLLGVGREVLRQHLLARLPLEEGEDGERFLVGEIELRHARLDALVGEDARDVQLLPDPVGVRLPVLRILGEVLHVAEVEQLDRLAPVLGQLGADLLRGLEALDVVAAEAAVLGDELLAFGGELLLFTRGVLRVGPRLAGLERHQISGDVGRLGVGEAEIRHLRVRPHRLGVLHPRVDPLGLRLVADVPEIGRVVALRGTFAAAGGRIFFGDVAGLAADALERLFALGGVALRRGGREQRPAPRARPEIGDDGRDFLLAQLLLPRQHLRVALALEVRHRRGIDRARPEVRHAGGGPPGLRVADPGLDEALCRLALDVGERRPAPRQIVVALDRVAAPAADVGEELLALREQRRLRQRHLGGVALLALRLHEGALELLAHDGDFVGERVVPVVVVLAVAELAVHDALGLRALAAVTGGAAERLRVVLLDQQIPAVRVRTKDQLDVERIGLRRLLEGRDGVLVAAGLGHAIFQRLLGMLVLFSGEERGVRGVALPVALRLGQHRARGVLEHQLRLRQPARVLAAVRLGQVDPLLVRVAPAALGRLRGIHRSGRRRRREAADGNPGRLGRHVFANGVVDLLIRIDDLIIDCVLRLHLRFGQLRLLRLQHFPGRGEPALVDGDVAVLAAIDRVRPPGVPQVGDPVLLHRRQLADAAVRLEPLVDVEDGLVDGVELRLRVVAPLDEGQLLRGRVQVVLDGRVVDGGLGVDLLLEIVEPLLLPLLFFAVVLVPRFAQRVVDGVLLRLDESEEELALGFLDACVLVGLHRRVVFLALLGVTRDGFGGGLQLRAQPVDLLFRLGRLEPLLRPLAIRAQVRLVELEELALVVLPGPARHHFVVDRPRRGQRQQHGKADERPLQALEFERFGGHDFEFKS